MNMKDNVTNKVAVSPSRPLIGCAVRDLPKPFYQDDFVTIYNGDCISTLQSLDDETFDAIITDPPFSSGARTDAGKAMRGGMQRGAKWNDAWFSHDNMATHGFVYLMRLLGVEAFRTLKNGGTGHFFIDWRMYPNLYGALESSGWQVKNLVVWDKQHFGMGTNYRNQHELIIYAEKSGQFDFRRKNLGNVLQVKRTQEGNHPTEKPCELIRILIDAVTEPNGIILDPFAGSGTTLVAAKNLGRKAIGIEISKDYCQIAVERLKQQTLGF